MDEYKELLLKDCHLVRVLKELHNFPNVQYHCTEAYFWTNPKSIRKEK